MHLDAVITHHHSVHTCDIADRCNCILVARARCFSQNDGTSESRGQQHPITSKHQQQIDGPATFSFDVLNADISILIGASLYHCCILSHLCSPAVNSLGICLAKPREYGVHDYFVCLLDLIGGIIKWITFWGPLVKPSRITDLSHPVATVAAVQTCPLLHHNIPSLRRKQ